jgi:hypothetical protein
VGTDTTYLDLDVAMADARPVFEFADFIGLARPIKPVKNHRWKPNWHKNVSGLRALRVLQEILPFLLGEKRREAERAIAFFGPFGSWRGHYRNEDVWPMSDFASRTKGRSSNLSLPADEDHDDIDHQKPSDGFCSSQTN